MVVRFGVLGTGNIADHALVPAIKNVESSKFWSVLSRDRERAASFAEKHGATASEPAYAEYEQMLADDELDAVVIATPDRLHAEQGIKAAEAGKHVFVEKPMVTDVEEGESLVDACRAADVKLGVAYHLRWHTGHRKLAERIYDGSLGTLHHIRVRWTFRSQDDSNWRAHEEVGRWWGLAGVGTHCLDLIRWFLVPVCGEVNEVESLIARDYFGSPHDETALVMLQFESGATAEITTSVLFESEPAVDVFGRDGSAHCRGTLGPAGRGDIEINGSNLSYSPQNPYKGEFKDFVNAVESDRPPEVDGEEGLRNVEILYEADPGPESD